MFDYKSVAVIVPERLGDTLFHTPSIRFLRKTRPHMRIEIVALSALAASVFENNPYVDAVHAKPNRRVLNQISSRCEAVLNIHNHFTSRQCVQTLNLPAITAVPLPYVQHAAAHSQEFFQQLLGAKIASDEKRYTLFPSPSNRAKIEALLGAHNVDASTDFLIGCHIGCHSIAKNGWKLWKPLAHPKIWPLQNFIALAAMLRREDRRLRLVLTGSAGEARMGQQFMRADPSVINLIGKTSTLDLAALMALLRVFVTSDTGALHVACATDVGLVALFGPTSPQVSGPYPVQPQHTIIRAQALQDIPPTAVYEAVINHSVMQNFARSDANNSVSA